MVWSRAALAPASPGPKSAPLLISCFRLCFCFHNKFLLCVFAVWLYFRYICLLYQVVFFVVFIFLKKYLLPAVLTSRRGWLFHFSGVLLCYKHYICDQLRWFLPELSLGHFSEISESSSDNLELRWYAYQPHQRHHQSPFHTDYRCNVLPLRLYPAVSQRFSPRDGRLSRFLRISFHHSVHRYKSFHLL